MSISNNNKRIAKNTLFLYVRMLLIMAVTLYTSRIIINALGVDDYGIYNVVGGIIAMLSFFNGSLSGASSRFITFSLGKDKLDETKEVFASVITIHLILAGVIVLLGETVGLWLVSYKLVIPPERMNAALWVYHCSVLTTVLSVVSIPYNSLIIAHERMKAFAYISIIEVLLKLVIVWILIFLPYDKLIVYAVLYLVIQFIIRLMYSSYCTRHFVESNVALKWNLPLMKKIANYAGWTMNGNMAILGYTQGINVLLNLFFGPAVNAARGIAMQVEVAVKSLVQNFQTAARPQIIKSYANDNLVYMHQLVIASSRYGFFLMLILTFPIMMCIHPLLKVWLGLVPGHTGNFVYIMLLTGLIAPFRQSLITAIHATGEIKKFQIYEGSSLLLVVPIAYFLLKVFCVTPETVMSVYLLVELFTQCLRIWIVLPKIAMSYSFYISEIFLSVFLLLPFIVFPIVFISIPSNLSIVKLLFYLTICTLYISVSIYMLGLTKKERVMIYSFIRKKLTVYAN